MCMVLPGNTPLAGVLDMYAILKLSSKSDSRDPLNCWLPYITYSFASIPYVSNATPFFTAMAIHISVLLILFFFQ